MQLVYVKLSILLLSTNLHGICSFAVLLLPQFKLFYLVS